MSNIEQNFCEAVDIIVNRAIEQAQFDKTIKATIVNLVDSVTGKYKVRYQDDLIYAYAGTADMDFTPGDEVYILVPQGNFSGDKTILGTTKRIGSAAGDEYVLPENERYEIIGNNVFSEGTEFRLCSYDSFQQKIQTTFTYNEEEGKWDLVPYKEGAAPKTFNIDAAAFSHYIKMADYLVLSAKIATNLPENQQYQGNYGFEVCLRFSTETGSSYEDRIYRIDTNNIQGYPWGLGVDGIQQYFYFKIPSDKFVSIQSVKVFAENFPTEPQDNTIYDWDIWIKDLSMIAANRISDDDLDSYFVRLITKNGSNFTRTNTSDKTIEAFVYEKSRNITNNSNLKYYWFYQRADVTTAHPNYCSYGGEGWYCLNSVVEEKDENNPNVIIRKTWKPATNTWIVKKEDVITENKVYKCVVLYDNTIIEKQVIFTRDDVEWSIALATTTGETAFYRDEGETQINCTIYDNLEPYLDHEKCTFKWMTINYLNSATLNESQTRTLNVKISSITYSSTYLCSAFINGEYIGTDSITLTNTGEDLNLPLYELMMINNSQVFKYDEDGISPTAKAQENPETILPLLLSIFNNKTGTQLDIGEGAGAKVTIYVPNKNTLIIPIGNKIRTEGEYDIYSYSSSGFSFDIKDKYNPSYKNNTIKVIVIYNKITLIGYTNFTFIKEGEDGTNGTRYVCRIVPNLKTGDNSYREWITWTNNEDGSRSYNFEPAEENNPFRVILLDGNDEVENISATWSALFRKYSSSIQENSLIEASSPKPEYLGMSGNGAPPASILKVAVKHEDNTYYATLPIVDIQRKDFNYNFIINNGLHDVIYNADGTNPKYDNSTPFSITVTKDGEEVTDGITYQWSILGKVYEKRDTIDNWYDAELLKQDYNDSTGTGAIYLVKPSSKYDGLCLSNGIQCIINKDGTEIATIIIPIHFYLNRFGHAAINAWDGNSIEINEDEGIILTPQVGAGIKDNNNAFTGMVMGEIKYGTSSKTGLVGYNAGSETMFLSAEDGSATFGAPGKGQIIISPGTNSAVIRGGNYGITPGAGMEINLSKPAITYGNGNFQVNEYGKLYAKGAKIEGSFDNLGDENSHFRVKMGKGEISFSEGSANITGDGLKIDFNTGRLSFNGGEEDTSSFTGYIQPNGFYFGSKYEEHGDGSKKGGSIRYADGTLTISGSFNAETGQLGGWNIADKELYSSGGTIRLYSGDPGAEKPIPAFISVSGDKGEIASNGSGEKASLRKGGLYLYTSTSEPDDTNFNPANWQGAIYTNSNFDNALTFSTKGANTPMYFFGSDVEGDKDSLVMRIQPGPTTDSKYVRIGYNKDNDENLTTLYPYKITVNNIKLNKKLNTKAQTIVEAINEIYPGGPVNIQHATVVLPQNKLDILYDYNVVMHTHSNEVGYGAQNINIYAQGYKLCSNFKTGRFSHYEERTYTKDGSEYTYTHYLYRDWNYIKQVNPQAEWYGSMTGTFFVNGVCPDWKGTEKPNWSDPSKVTNIASKHYETKVTIANNEDYYTTRYVITANGLPLSYSSNPYSAYYIDNEIRARLGVNPGTSLFCLKWTDIFSHQAGSKDFDLGFGYIKGYIYCGDYIEEWHTGYYENGQSYTYWSCYSEFANPGDVSQTIRIPFASQAEYEAAVNLISVDQKLYEIQQNKTTSS